jgi:hypothetical protein
MTTVDLYEQMNNIAVSHNCTGQRLLSNVPRFGLSVSNYQAGVKNM